MIFYKLFVLHGIFKCFFDRMLPFGAVQKDVTSIDLVRRGDLSGGGRAMARLKGSESVAGVAPGCWNEWGWYCA